MNMNCEKVKSLLSAYLDSELSSHEMRQIRLHLIDCETCKSEYESLRTTKDILGMLDSPSLPREFWPELRDRIKSQPIPKSYSNLFMKLIIPAAAMVILAILPFVMATHTRASKDFISTKPNSIEPYVREYIISELDRPFSDKTSLGFVAAGQAVTMYSSNLFELYDGYSEPNDTIPASTRTEKQTQPKAFQPVMFVSPK
ncbi:MAG: hypothetical protein GX969_04760 [Firmicutes bacterium]|nr:hypothetical protein [Bacillota bacterium]